MPNHVTTTCTVSGDAEQLAAFKALLFPEPLEGSDEGEGEGPALFDFQKLIPQPAIIAATESSSEADHGATLILLSAANPFSTEHGLPDAHWQRIRQAVPEAGSSIPSIAKAYLAKNPSCEAAGRAKMQALLETGYASWYDWNVANWGTKWDAYSVEVTEDGDPFAFRFETAWSFPEPIFHALIVAAPALLAALTKAEFVVRGFEDDELQEGMAELLAEMRAAMAAAGGEAPIVEIATQAKRWAYAAARDGGMLTGYVHADTDAEARRIAMEEAREYHCPDEDAAEFDESCLDGFTIEEAPDRIAGDLEALALIGQIARMTLSAEADGVDLGNDLAMDGLIRRARAIQRKA